MSASTTDLEARVVVLVEVLSDAAADGPLALAGRVQLLDGQQVLATQPVDHGVASFALPAGILGTDGAELAARFLPTDGSHFAASETAEPLVVQACEECADDEVTLASADRILEIAPQLLGTEGPRSYLVVFQNNAELRSTGGIPTAFAVLDAHDGRLTMRDEGTSPDIRGARPGEPVLPETAEGAGALDGKLAVFLGNANLTPHWPRTAELVHEFWRSATGESVDGVLSVDPVALSAVLRGTGPVPLRDARVATALDVVGLLMHRTYLDYPDQATQNAFFADSARRIFSALVEGRGDAGTALQGLHGALQDGRGYAWLSRPDEQRRVSAASSRASSPTATAGPSSASSSTTPRPPSRLLRDEQDRRRSALLCRRRQPGAAGHDDAALCRAPGHRLLAQAAGGPALDVASRRPAAHRLGVRAAGATFTGGTLDGSRGALAQLAHDGHAVAARTILLQPGQERRLTWTVRTGPGQGEAPRLRTTPTATGSGIGEVVATAC